MDIPIEPGFYTYTHWPKHLRSGPPLYVGQTSRPMARTASHIAYSPWWDDVAVITWSCYKTRDVALAAEQALIYRWQPANNVQGVDRENRRFNPNGRLHPKRVRQLKPNGEVMSSYEVAIKRATARNQRRAAELLARYGV